MWLKNEQSGEGEERLKDGSTYKGQYVNG